MIDLIGTKFGGKVRVRVLSLIQNFDKILLVNHKGFTVNNVFWGLPGGGVEKDETLLEALNREIKEELNLDILSANFYSMNEIIKSPLHAIEIIFETQVVDLQTLQLGIDPELVEKEQILNEYRWFNREELINLPKNSLQSNLVGVFNKHGR